MKVYFIVSLLLYGDVLYEDTITDDVSLFEICVPLDANSVVQIYWSVSFSSGIDIFFAKHNNKLKSNILIVIYIAFSRAFFNPNLISKGRHSGATKT